MTPNRTLDRKTSLPELVGDPSQFLVIASLAGVGQDAAELTGEADNTYILGGVMGAGLPMALGLALAQPDRRVLALVGDGDLLMFLSALSTVAMMQPKNLAIVCVDNGHFGETGYQETPTNSVMDLGKVAEGCGITNIHVVSTQSDIAHARTALHDSNAATFVWLRTTDAPSARRKRNFDGIERRIIFRRALLGHNE